MTDWLNKYRLLRFHNNAFTSCPHHLVNKPQYQIMLILLLIDQNQLRRTFFQIIWLSDIADMIILRI